MAKYYRSRRIRGKKYVRKTKKGGQSEDEKEISKEDAEKILKASFSKQRLHVLLMVNLCVLYNVYIDGDEKVRLYSEELNEQIYNRLKKILERTNKILNAYFVTDFFNNDIVFQEPDPSVPVMKEQFVTNPAANPDSAKASVDDTNTDIDNMFGPNNNGENPATGPNNNGENPAAGQIEQGQGQGQGQLGGTPENEDVEIINNTLNSDDKIHQFIIELSNDINDKTVRIKTTRDVPNFKMDTEVNSQVNLLIRFVAFLSKYLKLLENAKVNKANGEGRKIIVEGRVILAKSKMYEEMIALGNLAARMGYTIATLPFNVLYKTGKYGIDATKYIYNTGKKIKTRYQSDGTSGVSNMPGEAAGNLYNKAVDAYHDVNNPKIDNSGSKEIEWGGGEVDDDQINTTFRERLVIGTMQFFSKADQNTKEKYAFLLYLSTFLSMYEDNVFTNVSILENEGILTSTYKLALMPYRFGVKNPRFAILLGLLGAATQIAVWGQCVFPPLAVAAEPLLITNKVVTIVMIPFVDPSKIALYHKAELLAINKKLRSHNMNANLQEVANKYMDLVVKVLETTVSFTMEQITTEIKTTPETKKTTLSYLRDAASRLGSSFKSRPQVPQAPDDTDKSVILPNNTQASLETNTPPAPLEIDESVIPPSTPQGHITDTQLENLSAPEQNLKPRPPDNPDNSYFKNLSSNFKNLSSKLTNPFGKSTSAAAAGGGRGRKTRKNNRKQWKNKDRFKR